MDEYPESIKHNHEFSVLMWCYCWSCHHKKKLFDIICYLIRILQPNINYLPILQPSKRLSIAISNNHGNQKWNQIFVAMATLLGWGEVFLWKWVGVCRPSKKFGPIYGYQNCEENEPIGILTSKTCSHETHKDTRYISINPTPQPD